MFLKRGLTILLLPGLAHAHFGTQYWSWVEQDFIEAYPLPEAPTGFQRSDYTSADIPDSLLSLYRKQLTQEDLTWEQVELPSHVHMPTSHPTRAPYNAQLIRARNKKSILAYFRPIDTQTGCHTHCGPVRFHLQFDATFKLTALLEESQYPLTKIGHTPFSEADRALILKNAQKLPSFFSTLALPSDLTDALQSPPQTLTLYSPWVVPGAAYTSFRIYQALLSTHEFLTGPQKNFALQERELFINLLRTPLSQASQTLEDLKKTLLSRSAPIHEKQLAYYFLPKLWAWQALEDKKTSRPIKTLRALSQYFKKDTFPGTQQFCEIQGLLLTTSEGQKTLIAWHRDKRLSPCPRSYAVYPLLAMAAQGSEKKLFQKTRKSHDFKEIPPLLLDQPHLLELYARAAGLADQKIFQERTLAELWMRFPKYQPQFRVPPPSPSALQISQENWRRELTSFLLPEPRLPFPEIVGRQRSSQVTLPRQGKNIYLFFAAWCPHCQKTFAQLAKSDLKAPFLKRLQLVEVFIQPGHPSGEDICRSSELPSTLCDEVIALPPNEATRRGLDALDLYSVPRLLWVDKKKHIVATEYEMSFSKGRDPIRDMQWLLEELKP